MRGFLAGGKGGLQPANNEASLLRSWPHSSVPYQGRLDLAIRGGDWNARCLGGDPYYLMAAVMVTTSRVSTISTHWPALACDWRFT